MTRINLGQIDRVPSPAPGSVLIVLPDGNIYQIQLGPEFQILTLNNVSELRINLITQPPINFTLEDNILVTNGIAALKHMPILGSERVFINGLLQQSGEDYTIAGQVVTPKVFNPGDKITVEYRW